MTTAPRNRADPATRLGRFMLLGAWVGALALLALFFGHWLEREQNPNPNPRLTQGSGGQSEVVLRRNRAGHYVASGSINGEPVRFLIDTGATEVALPLSLAQRLGLRLSPGGTTMTANGATRTWVTRLERIDLGGLVASGVRASVLPNMPGEEVLLGMNYLKHLELIQRGDTLTLRHHTND